MDLYLHRRCSLSQLFLIDAYHPKPDLLHIDRLISSENTKVNIVTHLRDRDIIPGTVSICFTNAQINMNPIFILFSSRCDSRIQYFIVINSNSFPGVSQKLLQGIRNMFFYDSIQVICACKWCIVFKSIRIMKFT